MYPKFFPFNISYLPEKVLSKSVQQVIIEFNLHFV